MNILFSLKKIILVLIVLTNIAFSQNFIELDNLKSNFVKSENKEKYYSNLITDIEKTFRKTKIDDIGTWIMNLRNAQSILLKNEFVFNGIKLALSEGVDKHLRLQRTALEIAYTLYQYDFNKSVEIINLNTQDPISFAISSLYLINSQNKEIEKTLKLLKEKFPNFKKNILLKCLDEDLRSNNSYLSSAELKELLENPFQKGKTIIYTFHRKNRTYPGITIIKKPDGSFVRNEDGSLFHIPQLALSFSNLPYYIPNGNTPQGIYSIIGWYISPTETIGPTPNVLIRSPFEVDPDKFYHGMNEFNNWSIKDYQALLPKSLQNYDQFYHSFYAGKIGRKLIIIHGSTDDISFFEGKTYYPLTPTRGCISSTEIWSEDTGKSLKSDQASLINRYKSSNSRNGFLVVLEIDNNEKPVHIEEIEQLLNK